MEIYCSAGDLDLKADAHKPITRKTQGMQRGQNWRRRRL